MSKKKGNAPQILHVYQNSSVKRGMRNKKLGAQKEMIQHVIEDAKQGARGRAAKNKADLSKNK